MFTLLLLLSISLQMQVDSLCNRAYDCEDLGDFQTAIRLNEEALSITPQDSLQWISDISSNLTSEYFYAGNLEKATHYGLQALKIDEQLGNSENLSGSLNNLAAIYMQLNQLDEAITMAQRAVAIEEQLGKERKSVLAGRLGILSEALTKADRFEEALPYAERAVAIDRETNNIYKLGIHLSQLGNIYNQQYDYDYTKAAPYFEEAVPLLRATGNITSLVITLVPYAQTLRGTRRDKEAEAALKECIGWTWKTGQRQTRMAAYRELAAMYHVWNRRQVIAAGQDVNKNYGALSHDYFERFTLLKDSLYNEQMQASIANLEVKYETQKKEMAILQQQSVMKRQRIIIISIVVLAVVLLVLVLFIIKYARTQRHIAEEKNRMVSILSHDLKSPAIAQQRVLRQMADGTAKISSELITALASAQDAQVELILNMLDYARLEAGKVKVEPITLDLQLVAEDVIALLLEQAKQKNIAIKLSTSSSQALITADRTMVFTIMRNLVNNAIKFSPDGSEVVIEITQTGFAVKDWGIGFSAASTEKGTGLGLDICRRFAKLNQATLEIGSNEGQGTVVRVDFAKK